MQIKAKGEYMSDTPAIMATTDLTAPINLGSLPPE